MCPLKLPIFLFRPLTEPTLTTRQAVLVTIQSTLDVYVIHLFSNERPQWGCRWKRDKERDLKNLRERQNDRKEGEKRCGRKRKYD